MKKIAKVITSCHDCENCKMTISPKNNYTTAFICVVDPEEDKIPPEPFLLEYSEASGTSCLSIPENCPLEDYKEPKNEC